MISIEKIKQEVKYVIAFNSLPEITCTEEQLRELVAKADEILNPKLVGVSSTVTDIPVQFS